MYIALKGFSGAVISAYKNQVFEIKDKKVAKDLLDAGYIEEYSKESQSTAEFKKEVTDLKKQVATLESEKQTLLDANTKLEEEMRTLKESLENGDSFNESSDVVLDENGNPVVPDSNDADDKEKSDLDSKNNQKKD